jgi:hypothetical protein
LVAAATRRQFWSVWKFPTIYGYHSVSQGIPMHFVLAETSATMSALFLMALLILGGGALFAKAFRFPGFVEAAAIERAGIAVLCGFACLPVLLDLACRFGTRIMTAAAVAAALAGSQALLHGVSFKFNRTLLFWAAWAVFWILGATTVLIDWPAGSGFAHSFLVIDYVKHAAATWSVAQTGTPPWNPTYFEPGRRAVYYYFFYTLTAVVNILGGPIGVEARHAAYAGSIAVGFALFALVYQVWRRAGTDEAASVKGASWSAGFGMLVLLLTTGLDILPVLAFAGVSGGRVWFKETEWWEDQVTSWLDSTLYVPHHVAALCAAFVAFIALARAIPVRPEHRRILLALLAFASMAGLSIYVAIGAAFVAAIWLIVLLCARRFADGARLLLAGTGAIILAAPWLATLLPLLSVDGPPPIAIRLLGPAWLDTLFESDTGRSLARAIAMPFFYAIEFGIFGLGAFAFWRKAGRRGFATDLGQLLAIGTATSLIIGSFLRSTILNNDLGWRVMLFAQIATFVWTLSAARAGALAGRGAFAATARACLILGYVTIAYAVVQIRWNPPQDSLEQATLGDEIAAWSWLDAHLPEGAAVQSQPDVERAYSYGLYGRFPTPVSDHHNGRLFGASRSAVEARIADIAPIYSDPAMSYADVLRITAPYGISALVVTALDPVFADPKSWTANVPASYSNPHVRVFLLPEPANDRS